MQIIEPIIECPRVFVRARYYAGGCQSTLQNPTKMSIQIIRKKNELKLSFHREIIISSPIFTNFSLSSCRLECVWRVSIDIFQFLVFTAAEKRARR